MNLTENQSDFIKGITSLYYLVVNADGVVHEKEVQSGNIMVKHEHINENQFRQLLEQYAETDEALLYSMCLKALRRCNTDSQVRTIAWVSRVADADGYLDPKEWSLIYRTYEEELKLDLKKILEVRKSLPLSWN